MRLHHRGTFLALVLASIAARAQEAAPIDAVPVQAAPATPAATAAPAAPTAAAAVPAPARPPVVAPAEARAQLDRELVGLEGPARARRLLAFIVAFPDDPSAAAFDAEVRTLLGSGAGADPLVERVNAALRASGDARRTNLNLLADLHDSRALPVLGYVARRDADLETRKLGTRLLGRFQGDEAAQFVQSLLTDGNEPVAIRNEAARTLAATGAPQADQLLLRLAQDTDEPTDLRQAASDELRSRFPKTAEALGANVRITNSSGRGLATLVGALAGSYTLGLVGALSPNEGVGTAVGAFGGLVIGGAAANLLSVSYPISQGDAAFFLSAGAWSVPVGYFMGELADPGCNGKGCTGMMLTTHLLALGGAWYVHESLGLTVRDVLETNLAAGALTLLSYGLLQLPTPTGDLRAPAAIMALSMTGGFVGGALLAPKVHLEGPGLFMTALAATELGFAMSLLGPSLVPSTLSGPLGTAVPNDRARDQIWGLSLVGAGVGVAAVLGASAAWRPTVSDVTVATASAINGHIIGAGLGLLAGASNGDRIELAAGLGGLAGTALGLGVLKPLDLELKRGDTLLLTFGEAFGAAQAFGWTYFATMNSSTPPDRGLGAASLGTGLIGVGMLALTQQLDLSPWVVGWTFSGAVWGAWLAGWGAYAADVSGRNQFAAILLGGDIGLAAAAILTSPIVGLDPTALAWMSVGGVAGMTAGTMLTVFSTSSSSNGHPVAIGNVVGSVIGLAAGAGLAYKLHDAPASPSGSGGDLLGGVPVPMPSFGPMTDPNGRVVRGGQAQLVWSL